MLAEADIMKQMDHRNVVKILAECTRGSQLCICLEWMPNGELNSLLQDMKHNGQELEPKDMIFMASEVP